MTNYALPTSIGIANITLRAQNAVAYEESPFTFAGQVQTSTGERWLADVSIPPVRDDLAEEWVAFLVKLRGMTHTFLMGDPNRTIARGSARGTDTVTVNGGSQTGEALNINTDQINAKGYLLPGDYIQLGSGSTSTLHKVLETVDTSAIDGSATVTLWPAIRTAPASGATVVVEDAKGRFRLASNTTEWSINETSVYGISFSAMEAI